MSDNTGIEWCDATWNPVTGCTEVSPGCDHCYAKTFAERWRGTEGHYFENGFDVQLRPDKLDQPLHWKRPRRIFVNSMSDLFHDSVPDNYIGAVFDIMAKAPRHTFQILTKRHARMRSLLNRWSAQVPDDLPQYKAAFRARGAQWAMVKEWPLPNVWLGVSTEDQQRANLRIPALIDTPAAVRFVSAEPLLGPIDFTDVGYLNVIYPDWCGGPGGGTGAPHPLLDWVIVGGESGAGARPMDPDWVRAIRDRCENEDVPFLFKQWGGRTPKAGGRELDGRTWDQYPEAVTA